MMSEMIQCGNANGLRDLLMCMSARYQFTRHRMHVSISSKYVSQMDCERGPRGFAKDKNLRRTYKMVAHAGSALQRFIHYGHQGYQVMHSKKEGPPSRARALSNQSTRQAGSPTVLQERKHSLIKSGHAKGPVRELL